MKKMNEANAEYDYTTETVKPDWKERANPWRPHWSGKLDFIMAGLGYAIGTGNVWKFPYMCLKHGGMAFIVPYLVSMMLVAMPLLLMEISLGQYTSEGPITCWKMAPLSKGIGVGMIIVTYQVAIYYNMILGWSLFYTAVSFDPNLPFLSCGNSYNTPFCVSLLSEYVDEASCKNMSMIPENDGVCYHVVQNKTTPYAIWNNTLADLNKVGLILPETEYLAHILGYQSHISLTNLGDIVWKMVLVLGAAWIIVYIVLYNGIKLSGKLAYVTVVLPILILFLLTGLCLSLDGAAYGISYLFGWFDVDKFSSPGIWMDALVTNLFSLSLAQGAYTTLGSYNAFHNNCLKDTVIFCAFDVVVGLMGAVLIFGVAGFVSTQSDMPLDNFAYSGVDLAFVGFPSAMRNAAHPALMCGLFFVCLFLLGVDSQIFFMEVLATSIEDLFPKLHIGNRKKIFRSLLCLITFVISIPLCLQGGVLIFQFLSRYAANINLLILGFLHLAVISWIYGAKNFMSDIAVMLGNQKTCFMTWKIWSHYFYSCWLIIAPFLIVIVVVYSFVKYPSVTYNGYDYPGWATAIGFIIDVLPVAVAVLFCIVSFLRAKGSFTQKLKQQFSPQVEWGPVLVKHRVKIVHLKDFNIDPHWVGF